MVKYVDILLLLFVGNLIKYFKMKVSLSAFWQSRIELICFLMKTWSYISFIWYHEKLFSINDKLTTVEVHEGFSNFVHSNVLYVAMIFYVFSLTLRRLLMTHVDDLIMQHAFYARSTYFVMLMELWTQLSWRSNKNDTQSYPNQISPLILIL